MTEQEFENLQLGNYILNNETGEIGQVVVGNHREWYVKYPSNPDSLVEYDPINTPECWKDINILHKESPSTKYINHLK